MESLTRWNFSLEKELESVSKEVESNVNKVLTSVVDKEKEKILKDIAHLVSDIDILRLENSDKE